MMVPIMTTVGSGSGKAGVRVKGMSILRALTVATMIAASACSNPEGPSSNGTTINGQTLAVTIDGTVFQPNSIVVTRTAATGSTPETLSILASDGGTGGGNAQTVTMTVPAAVGTYQVGSTFLVVNLRRGMFAQDAIWEASNTPGMGSGSTDITSRSSATADGRINVTMAAAGVGAGSTSKVIAGTFSVRF